MKFILWLLFALMAISIGLYPSIYFLIDRKFGLLSTKDAALLADIYWNICFYAHIICGGIALTIGWVQFNDKFRETYKNWHRNIGKVYTFSALISAFSGFYIAIHATGGYISVFGFMFLALFWLYTSLQAYLSIRKGDVFSHKNLMIYSYAACFAAVTLRIWLPLLIISFQDFIIAYRIVSWLCWLPNLILAYFIVKNQTKS